MTDAEANVKLAIIFVSVLGVIAVGLLTLYVIIPALLIAGVIDFGMRQSYNAKLANVGSSEDLIVSPAIYDFEARIVEGQILVGWRVDLPGDAFLDIYRVTEHGGGSIDELNTRGYCVHTTGRELTENKDQLFVDAGLPEGTYYYVPVVSGMVIEKEPLPYSLFDFAKDVQFRTRRTRRAMRGEAVPVVVAAETIEQIPDLRDEPSKLADDVMSHILSRRKFDADLDAAISRINDSGELSEEEKQEAIELLETRATAK